MKYRKNLTDEGMHDERALDATMAIAALYRALNQMDQRNLDQFMSKSIEQRLSEFAIAEGGMRDFINDRNAAINKQTATTT